MKINKKVVLLLSVIIVVLFLLWYNIQPVFSTIAFQRNSVEYIKTTEYAVESVFFERKDSSTKAVDNPKLEDFKVIQPLDPAVWFSTDVTLTAYVPLKTGSQVQFHTLRYTENGKEKTADIGRYDIRFKKGNALQESEISGSSQDERCINIRIHKQAYGKLKKVEAVNRDLQLESVNISEDQKNYQINIRYKPFSEYDYIYTSLKYTFEKAGKEEIYYGEQVLPIHKEFGMQLNVIFES